MKKITARGVVRFVCILVLTGMLLPLTSCSSGDTRVLRLALSTSDGSTSADRTPSPWLNRSLPMNLMYRSLFLADHTLGNVTPDLAESYTVTQGGKRYEITMKDSLHWSDGTALGANDVVFSVTLARHTVSLNPVYSAAFAHVTDVYTEAGRVVFILDEPSRTFVNVLAQFAILPEHKLSQADPLTLDTNVFWQSPVTSGMYAFESLAQGSYFTLTKNAYYEGAQSEIEAVHVSFVTDVQSAALAGECDIAVSNSTETVQALEKDKRFTSYLTDTLFYKYLIFNVRGTDGKENSAMQNEAFRRAVAAALDRSALAKLYPGSTVLSTGDPSYKEVSAYDSAVAREQIAASGYDLSRPVRICYYSSDRTSEDLISTIVHYLEEAGLKTEVFLSNDGTRDLFVTREYDIALKGKSAFDVEEWYGEYLSTDTLFSAIFGGETAFDRGVSALRGAQDSTARRLALEELRALEERYCLKIPLFSVGTYVFVSERITLPEGIKFGNPNYLSDLQLAKWKVS